MILYNHNIDPPAPFVEVIVRHPTTGQQDILPAQLDTGADISGIPQQVVDLTSASRRRSSQIPPTTTLCR